MASDTDATPGKIFGYQKQVHFGRNPIEDIFENIKGVLFGPLIWIRGKWQLADHIPIPCFKRKYTTFKK